MWEERAKEERGLAFKGAGAKLPEAAQVTSNHTNKYEEERRRNTEERQTLGYSLGLKVCGRLYNYITLTG